MTEAGGKKAVVYSAVLTTGMVTLNSMVPVPEDKEVKAKYPELGQGVFPSMRTLIGLGVTFTTLSLGAEFAPELAGMLAVTIFVTALTFYGIPLMDTYFVHVDPNSRKVQTP
jgi:hypothetical protein